jgi:phage-related protein
LVVVVQTGNVVPQLMDLYGQPTSMETNFGIFCFFDQGNLIILLNGFQKKTEKTPKNEIDRAERLKQKYYEEKSSK